MTDEELLAALREPCATCGHARAWHVQPGQRRLIGHCLWMGVNGGFCSCLQHLPPHASAADDAAELDRRAMEGPSVG